MDHLLYTSHKSVRTLQIPCFTATLTPIPLSLSLSQCLAIPLFLPRLCVLQLMWCISESSFLLFLHEKAIHVELHHVDTSNHPLLKISTGQNGRSTGNRDVSVCPLKIYLDTATSMEFLEIDMWLLLFLSMG